VSALSGLMESPPHGRQRIDMSRRCAAPACSSREERSPIPFLSFPDPNAKSSRAGGLETKRDPRARSIFVEILDELPFRRQVLSKRNAREFGILRFASHFQRRSRGK